MYAVSRISVARTGYLAASCADAHERKMALASVATPKAPVALVIPQ